MHPRAHDEQRGGGCRYRGGTCRRRELLSGQAGGTPGTLPLRCRAHGMSAVSGALLPHFLAEARELVQQASDDLLAIERDPEDAERIDRVFRAFHTLKGSASLFAFGPLTATLHAAEDLLSALREGRLAAGTWAVVDPALDCL